MRSNRAVSVTELVNKKFQLLPFEGAWLKSFGRPEIGGSWIIWGQSGSGKTHFTLQLCKYFTRFTRVVYNSLEEGGGPTMQKKFRDMDMEHVKRKFILVRESVKDLIIRIEKKKSPGVIVIDSVQYSGLNYREYIQLKDRFPHKLFVFVSHADGREPKGNTARSIRFDAHAKIYIEGYRAFIVSRFGGGEPYTIWAEGAKMYWAEEIVTKN